jgi:hypothetical protein
MKIEQSKRKCRLTSAGKEQHYGRRVSRGFHFMGKQSSSSVPKRMGRGRGNPRVAVTETTLNPQGIKEPKEGTTIPRSRKQ